MNEASNFCTGDVCRLKAPPGASARQLRAAAAAVREDPEPWVR